MRQNVLGDTHVYGRGKPVKSSARNLLNDAAEWVLDLLLRKLSKPLVPRASPSLTMMAVKANTGPEMTITFVAHMLATTQK